MVAPVALADRPARDPALVGVKAARLAAAAAAGLPVLEGRVLPSEASSEAIASGGEALQKGAAAAGAYLAAMESVIPSGLSQELAPQAADQLCVVRSSTLFDDDGRWSGAFASYVGVAASDLATAVRGAWASAFSTDALARCRETGTEVGSLRIGVLIQPFLVFEAGGTARVQPDGTVVVTSTAGGPAGVVGGRGSGLEVIVGVDGRVVEGLDGAVTGAGTVEAAAALARRAAGAVAAGVIEWGATGDELVLLQIGPTPPEAVRVAERARPARVPERMPADAERLARLVTAYPGPLGDELVTPWAIGSEDLPAADRIDVDDPVSALSEARTSAGDLAAEVWGASPAVARKRAATMSRLLLEGHVTDGCREIRDLPAPDPTVARRVVGLVRGVAAFLAEAGFLPSPLLVWRLTASELERAIAGERPSLRRGPGRWEPFVADVVRARGVHTTGRPVSPGIAAGQLHPLRELRAMGRPGLRDVLVTPLPLPHLAPLLWHSAAIVSIGGSSGAHLFEVARSLGVPAVIGVEAAVSGGAGSLVAVDGDTGVVSVLLPDATAPVPSSEDIRAMV
jgi:phosphohistidine swiveling domain-containing protein